MKKLFTLYPIKQRFHLFCFAGFHGVNFLLFTLFTSLLLAEIIEVKQDGTGNFTSIQEGIDASTDTDTILVYPGTYYENIIYNGKNITVASLELITGDESYIDSTIIDGSQLESCVRVIEHETDAKIQGLTIRNGSGNPHNINYYYGGGILVEGPYADPVYFNITNCIITENYASAGAGICLKNGIINLSGTSIRNNSATGCAGGIHIYDYSGITFSASNLCSIYDNYAALGCDLYLYSLHIPNLDVIVDTFTVQNPSRYFAQYKCHANYNPYTFDIQHHSLELVNHDIYVATDGDDTNSGLSPDEPMKTINLAIRKIESDSLNPKTVHLANGIYNENLNQQFFPVGCKSNINIIGESESSTIIDSDNNFTYFIYIDYGKENFLIKNITLENLHCPFCAIGFTECSDITFENITLRNIVSEEYGAMNGGTACENITMNNVKFINCMSYHYNAGLFINAYTRFEAKDCVFKDNFIEEDATVHAGIVMTSYGEIFIENCIFDNNTVINTANNMGICTFINGHHNDEIASVYISNCLFSNNTAIGAESIFWVNAHEGATISNCIFVNNDAVYTSGFVGDVIMSNIIMYYNDSDYEIFLPDITPYVISTLDISYCNIQGGQDAIYNQNGVNIVNWLEGNIDEDPLFFGTPEQSYLLSPLSPCIDTGTPDTTGLYLPPWDLLHNYRVWDGDDDGVAVIDMGCYEYGAPPVAGIDEPVIIPPDVIHLSNYPNPFNPETKIVFNLPESVNVKLEIYNIKGQKVKTLMDCYTSPGDYELIWDGKDNNRKHVASGVYLYQLQVDGKAVASRKCLLLK
ncbi:MAG: T9SS type A sorting domain-containing protein [Candidatus Cloacimonetes bacterium]|nr:T9SS type A sorting domain-containing protein [Candidatus Cloacimonadota bacterium]